PLRRGDDRLGHGVGHGPRSRAGQAGAAAAAPAATGAGDDPVRDRHRGPAASIAAQAVPPRLGSCAAARVSSGDRDGAARRWGHTGAAAGLALAGPKRDAYSTDKMNG